MTGRKELPKKQAELIAGARKLFRLHGGRRITVEEICRESGVSKMTYYKYFSNKWEMVKTVLDVMFEELMERYDAVKHGDMPFQEKVEKLLRLNREHVNSIGPPFLKELMNPDCPVHEHFFQQQLKSRDLSLEFFAAAKQAGHIRQDISMPFLLFMLNQMFELANHPQLIALIPSAEDRIYELSQAFFYGFARTSE